MRILLIGPSGQIGRELQRSLPTVGEVITAGRRDANVALDLTSDSAIEDVVRTVCANVVVNAAAYTAVDKAETDQDAAFVLNAVAPGTLAECAKSSGALLVHFSTDYVFDGQATSAYSENDPTNPVSVYGRSKLTGENAIRDCGVHHLIFRTSWVYGLHGKNFLLTILRLASEGKALNIVDDQFGVPNWSRTLASAVTSVINHATSTPDRLEEVSGTYHLTATGETSWHGFAQAILDSVKDEPGIRVKTAHPIPTRDFPTAAARPVRSTLAGGKLSRTFGVSPPDWRTCLGQCLSSRQASNG